MILKSNSAIARLAQITQVLAALGCAPSNSPTPFPEQSVPGMVYPSDVREFVKLNFIHGVPYKVASEFGPAAIPVLLGILDEPNDDALWPNAVTTLGMIGDPQAIGPLIAFIESGEGSLSSSRYSAKTNAIMALGYIANRSGDQKALTYLKKSTDPEAWLHQVAWTSPYAPTKEASALQLAEVAILGLALSGRPLANEVLRDLQAQGTAPGATSNQRRLGKLAGEALDEYALIAKEGLVEYYR